MIFEGRPMWPAFFNRLPPAIGNVGRLGNRSGIIAFGLPLL